jgi:hypothetical protein
VSPEVAWVTLVPGHGPHPKPDEWVTVYGGKSIEGRDFYYLAKAEQASHFESYVALTDMTVGEKRRYWVRYPGSTPIVHDVELAAILGAAAPASPGPQFPPPGDASRGANGERYVVVHSATGPASGAHPEPTDRVLFDVVATGRDGAFVDLGIKLGTVTLADVPVPAVIDALRDTAAGEMRYVWTTHAGKPLWLRIWLYSVEKRTQLVPPPDVLRPPLAATHGERLDYVVLAPGHDEPPDLADEVTLDYAVWTSSGRTIESHAGPQLARDLVPAFAAQVAAMRTGEHRRIWFTPAAAGYYSENGRGATADVKLIAIKRNVQLLPGGLAIARAQGGLAITRGSIHAPLPVGVKSLDALGLDRGIVTLTGDNYCDVATTATIPLAQLEALVEGAAAEQALAAAKYTDAVAGLAKAVALAPELDELHRRLAIAYVRAGRRQEALAALAAHATVNPVWTYWRVTEDPELAPLAAEPELAPLRARVRGKIDVEKMPVMIDPSGQYVAVPIFEASWGSGDGELRIEVLDLRTNATVATIPRVTWTIDPSAPQMVREVARRKAQVEAMLDDLGFAAPKGLEAASTRGDRMHSVTTLAKAGLVIDSDKGILRGSQVVEPFGVDGNIHAAYWLPASRRLVIAWGRPGAEGCESTDPEGIAVVAVP